MGLEEAWLLVWASIQPVLKVVLLCSVGAICRRCGLLTHEGRKTLSGLSFLVFSPCLNAAKLGASVTASRLMHWWPLMLNVGIM